MSVNIPIINKPQVVIIGGGFGGIQLAKGLKNADVQIVLVDRNNYHTFQPLLYQVATGGLEPDSIAYPLRKIFRRQKNFIFRMAEVTKINPQKNLIETTIGEIAYDYLVIANGAKTNYFDMEEIKPYVMPLKNIPQALDLRSLILQNFEKALLTNDIKERDSLMTFAVVGGGPTGIELAGALGELKNHIMPRDYPELDITKMQIHIIDLNDRLLPTMSKEASSKTAEFLQKFGVNIWLNTNVTGYNGQVITLNTGKKVLELAAGTVIWAAGVRGRILAGIKEDSTLNGSRFKVDVYNRLDGYNNIFAIGDIAAMITEKTPRGQPMLAPVAMQQGRLLAKNLKRIFQQKKMKPFVYTDKGMMATIGRNRAVVDLAFLKFQGALAWFIWMFVHLIFLVGFRNRLIVFINWAWNYFSYDRGIRLIIRPFLKQQPKKTSPPTGGN